MEVSVSISFSNGGLHWFKTTNCNKKNGLVIEYYQFRLLCQWICTHLIVHILLR